VLDSELAPQVVAAAHANGIDPAALLAVVEVESSGQPFERADGITPCFLLERHIFYKQLSQRAPEKLSSAVAQGLAHEGWRRSTQYRDQKTSAGRLALLARARVIDPECADRSCSWGLGQTMGFHAQKLGFPNAISMVHHVKEGGVPAQLDILIRTIRNMGLIGALNQHNWASFARGYNGPAYRQNNYDRKLAAAYARWSHTVPTPDGPRTVVPPASSPASDLGAGAQGAQVEQLQRRLAQLGFDAGEVDGIFGPKTRNAVLAFQTSRGLPRTGRVDSSTWEALRTPTPDSTTPQEVLRMVLTMLLDRTGSSVQSEVLPAILAALLGQPGPVPASTSSTAPTPAPILSPIDKAIGGEALAGKKTALAVVAYAALSILQALDVVGTATGAPAPGTMIAPAATPTPTAGTPAAVPLSPATSPSSPATAGTPARGAPATPQPDKGTKTPAGQILTTLILAFGGLGLLGKIDRLFRAVGIVLVRPCGRIGRGQVLS